MHGGSHLWRASLKANPVVLFLVLYLVWAVTSYLAQDLDSWAITAMISYTNITSFLHPSTYSKSISPQHGFFRYGIRGDGPGFRF
ncbi:hypothetical protein F5Y16DRAFT_382729 [Xylariaceae sp. FL0255]|nr:hypothetical protein F5Y16DRAFT_382729 [Xylariaceae sp. FL0255]